MEKKLQLKIEGGGEGLEGLSLVNYSMGDLPELLMSPLR